LRFHLAQAINQLCCASRTSRSSAFSGGNEPGSRRLCKRFSPDGQEATITIVYRAVGRDADAFARAFERNDLAALVGLLHSDEAVAQLVEPKHPWAEDPCTIGTLSAMQLALLSSIVAKDDPSMKGQIGRAGAVAPLVEFLRSSQQDRIQAAIVALNYLTDDCSPNAHDAFREGAMPLLIELLGSPLAAMRGAAASTLRNICMESEEYCKTFTRLGGIRGFVNQLDSVSDPKAVAPCVDSAELALEAVWNLEEIMTDVNGVPIRGYAKLAAQEGALEKLQRLHSLDDMEVSMAVERVVPLLTQAMEPGPPPSGGQA